MNNTLLFLCAFSSTLCVVKDTTVTFTKTYSVADGRRTRDASFSDGRETQAASVGDLDGDGTDEILVAGVKTGKDCELDCSLLFLSKTKTTKPFPTSYSVSVVRLSTEIQIVILGAQSSKKDDPDKTVKIYRILSRTEFPGELISPEDRLQLWQELNTGPSATFKRIGDLEIIGIANQSLQPVPGSNPDEGREYNVAIWKYTGSTSEDSKPFAPLHWLNTTGPNSDRVARWVDFQVLGEGHEIRAIVVGSSQVATKVGFFRFDSNMKLLSDRFHLLSDEPLYANLIRVEACTVMIATKYGVRIYEYNPARDKYELHYEDSTETKDIWCKMINRKTIFFMVRQEKQRIDVFEHYDDKNGELVIKKIQKSLDVPSKPLYATIERFVVNQRGSVSLVLTHDLGAEVYQITVE